MGVRKNISEDGTVLNHTGTRTREGAEKKDKTAASRCNVSMYSLNFHGYLDYFD